MPGTAILKFDPANMMVKAGDVELELVQNLRVEIGELVGIAQPRNYEEALAYIAIRERHDRGDKFPVRWLSGTCYGDQLPVGAKDLEWLKHLRVYRVTEIIASIPTEDADEGGGEEAPLIEIPRLVMA